MYCFNCGKELPDDSKFCQCCGSKLCNNEEIKEINEPFLEQDETKESSDEAVIDQNVEKSTLKKVLVAISNLAEFFILVALLFYFNCNIWIAIFLLVFGLIGFVLEKMKKTTLVKITNVITIILVAVSIYNIYIGYQNKKAIDTVKQQEYMGVSFDVLFDEFSSEPVWSCIKRGKFTVVDPFNSDNGGSYNAVVSVSGDCYLYDEPEIYTLEFNVSTADDEVVPTSIKFSEIEYYSDSEIELFLNSMYENYLSKSDTAIDTRNQAYDNNVTIDNCELVYDEYDGSCVDVIYTFTNQSDSSNSFPFMYEDTVFQNGIECRENDFYILDASRKVSVGSQYTFKKRYILMNEIEDVTIEVVASALNSRDLTDVSVTYTMSELLGIENKENPRDDTDYSSFFSDFNDFNDNSYIDKSESSEHKETKNTEPDSSWLNEYNCFYNEEKTLKMNIYKQNGVMLCIDIGNEYATESWTVNAEPEKINADGGIVYENDIKGATLTYYPDGRYVEFEDPEVLFSGKYYSDHQ